MIEITKLFIIVVLSVIKFIKFNTIPKLKISVLNGILLNFFENIEISNFLFLKIDEFTIFKKISLYTYIKNAITLNVEKFKLITLFIYF